MRGNVLMAVAIVAILGITCVTVLEDSGDVEAATGDVTITSASGTIGTGVNWSFSNGALTITQATGTGSKTIATGLDSDSTSTSGWGSTWKVTGHTESTPSTGDGGESQTPASATNTIDNDKITPEQVFGSGTFRVTIDAGISIADGAFANIRASEVGFSAIGNTTATIGEGAFENCITLTKVDLGHVTSVGTDAFRGCTVLNSVSNAGSMETISAGAFSNCGSLETVDIGTSKTVDQTAFQGCAKLATINVSNSNTSYNRDSATGLIYTEDYHTLYICPPAKTGAITSVNPAVTTVNLDYANVDYIINLDDLTGGDVEFVAVTGAKASGIAFSTQSMSQIASASISGTTFTMRYALYDGWTVNSTVATVLDGSSRATVTSATETELSFTVVDGHGYMVYPVGYASITPDDLPHPCRRRQYHIAPVREPFHICRNNLFSNPLYHMFLQKRAALTDSETRNIVKIVFVSRMIGIDHRYPVFLSKIERPLSYKHRVMDMDAIKRLFFKNLQDLPGIESRIYHSVIHSASLGVIPYHPLWCRFILRLCISVSRCKYRHLVPKADQLTRLALYGNRNASNKRSVIIRKHCYLHSGCPLHASFFFLCHLAAHYTRLLLSSGQKADCLVPQEISCTHKGQIPEKDTA